MTGSALAAVALVVFAVLLIEPLGEIDPAPFRQPPPLAIDSPLERGAVLDRQAFVLRWSGAPSGTLYTLVVATRDLDVLHRAEEIEQDSYRVPADRFAGLAPGTTILWRVEAVLPDARHVSSPTFRVTLGP